MNPAALIFFIPIIAIVMTLGSGMLKIYLSHRNRKEMFALHHQERMAAIEKGVELQPMPENFFREDAKPFQRSPHRALQSGLVMVFIGVTLYFALHLAGIRTNDGGDAGPFTPGAPLGYSTNHGGEVAPFALIPVGIGVANLLYYFTVGRKQAAAMEEERKARLAQAARAQNPPA